jgi:hypothetical protein
MARIACMRFLSHSDYWLDFKLCLTPSEKLQPTRQGAKVEIWQLSRYHFAVQYSAITDFDANP